MTRPRTLLLTASAPDGAHMGALEGVGFVRVSGGPHDVLLDFIPWHERDDFSGPWCSGDRRILRGTE